MTIERISNDFVGGASDGAASGAGVSSSGRYVVYVSDADDIAGGHGDGGAGVYVRDTRTGDVQRIDQGVGGEAVNGSATNAKVSGDGRYITYTSTASNLVDGGVDDNGAADVFVYDRLTGTTKLISTSADGTAATGASTVAGISDNGRYIAYISEANDIDATHSSGRGDNNTLYASADLFVYDTVTGETTRVTDISPGLQVAGHPCVKIAVDTVHLVDNSGFVHFSAEWTSSEDVTLYGSTPVVSTRMWSDMARPETATDILVSRYGSSIDIEYGVNGEAHWFIVGDGRHNDIANVTLAADGRFIVYSARFDQNGTYHEASSLYLFDAKTGQTVLLAEGLEGDPFRNVQISADGGWVTFETDQPLTPDDTNGRSDVFRVKNPLGTAGAARAPEPTYDDGVEWLIGSSGADELLGIHKADRIKALEGDDVVQGYHGDDEIHGGEGSDRLFGGTGSDRISGGEGDDTIHGDASDASEHGNGGSLPEDEADFLDGGAGNDAIYGNGGDDRINGGAGRDTVAGGDGDDRIYGGRNAVESDWLSGGAGDDVIHGDDGRAGEGDRDFIFGDAGNDILNGNGGDDVLFGGDDADVLWGGDGDDVLVGGRNADNPDMLLGGEGDDVLHGDGETSAPDDGEDFLDGGAGSDILYGRGGNDTLIGGANAEGLDELQGGAGDDTLYGDRETDDPDDEASDDGMDLLRGNEGMDTIHGNGGTDSLWGGDDEDTLYGGAGDDWLFGERATLFDTLFGGAGDDRIFGDMAYLGDDLNWVGMDTDEDSGDLIFGGDGGDIVYAGGGNDEVWGEHGGDILDGQSGYDVLIGGAGGGMDGLFGGQGRDLLIGDGAIRGDDLTFIAVESEDDDGDIIDGGTGDDEIWGGGGDDLLEGGEGADLIFGGTGADTISGDDGDDTIYAEGDLGGALRRTASSASRGPTAGPEGGDVLDGGAGNDTLFAGLGSRLIGGSGSDTFVLGFESLGSVIEDMAGGAGGDRISLGGVLDGIVDNWDGETNLFATGHLKLEAREGSTVLLFDADGSAGAGVAVELATFAGVAPAALTGANFTMGDYGHVIVDPTRTSVVQGTQGADVLTGTDGNDTLAGLGGDDVISGRGGDDDLNGGYGADALLGEGGADLLRGGHGNDALDGGEGDDVLIGGDGSDTLLGGDGDDVLHLDTGVDTLSGGAGDDVFVASRYFAGQDIILDFEAGQGEGDVIDLTQLTDVFNLQQLRGRISVDANGDVRIAVDAATGSYVTLKGVKPEDLAADDFRFAVDPNNPDPVNRAPTAIELADASIDENAAAGTVVGTVRGVDPDGDSLTYALVDDAGGRFAIDPLTGAITALQSFDHEAEPSFQVIVRVTDPGGAYLDRTITLQIADVNEAPHSVAIGAAVVAENAPAGTAVGTVTASDPEDGGLTYSLADDADGLFVIDPQTGVVSTTRPLDHEARDSYEIVVRATDAGGLSADHAVTVAVGDVNEAPGTIILPGNRVTENAAAGAEIGTAAAEDPEGDALVYSLADDAEGRFRIDPATGRITTTGPLDHEATPSLRIVIRATDAQGAWVDREATIVVEDVAEGPVGRNDGPLQVDEDATSANLWSLLLANDEAGSGGLSITSVNTAGTQGGLVFDPATRTLKYVADADAFDLLAPGATATDTFTYTVTDASGQTSTATVTFTVRGVADGRVIKGGNGRDTLTGTTGEDVITGENGNDILYGLGGADRLDGGNGTDKLYGGAGMDTLKGGNGDDLLDGGQGDDRLDGGLGQDQLFGGAGDDFLIGGYGNDLLAGGEGADTFEFGIASGIDKILDFDADEDSLTFSDGVKVLFHEIADNNGDGVMDTVLVTNLGGVIIMLGVEHPVGPSLDEYLRPLHECWSPRTGLGEPMDYFL